tara:strand:+ start:470 stop:826 length:357 start_codon:yes stop_codon:yes gene_type:complete
MEMMIYTQTSFKHKKKKTKSKRKLAESTAYWEWRKKHGSHPSQLRSGKKNKTVYTGRELTVRETPHVPSLQSSWAPCTKSKNTSYTGGNMVGIGTLHKSNAIPIFTDDDAKDLSKMRR